MYSLQDVDLVNEKIDDIIEGIDEEKLKIFEPTREEIMNANKIVMDYIKENKRKIYGGFAQNKAVVAKEPKDTFYKETELPDIDFYSPDPLNDVINIANRLHEAGFKYAEGGEAAHRETYKVYANYFNVADISYVPRNIYNKIPFLTIDGINYVHPSFMMIDLYRMMTEPYFSSFRWKKIFPRLYKLQKHYPFNKATSPLNSAYDIPKDKQEEIKKINDIIIGEIENKDNYIIVGQYAYNCYLEESGVLEDKSFKNKYKIISVPFMQLISTNYIPDTIHLIKILQKKYGDKITYREFYPLWQFTGYSTVVYYEQIPILHITSHNDRCIPTRKIKINKSNSVQIGSFDLVFLMNLIALLRVRVNEIEDKVHYHNITTSHLIEMRDYFFKKHKKNLLDDTLFQSFISECVGSTMDPMRESLLASREKREKSKPSKWRYDPRNPRAAPDYKFANTSGNEIVKSRNLKIGKYINQPELLEKLEKHEQEEEQEEQE